MRIVTVRQRIGHARLSRLTVRGMVMDGWGALTALLLCPEERAGRQGRRGVVGALW
ncbi:MAG: hypothetical protein ACRDRX_11455 [Pseudonocardiaceae bacterium]